MSKQRKQLVKDLKHTIDTASAIKEWNITQIDKKELQFKTFDMIGLIDSQNLTQNFSSNDINISVSGRDLMKLFIEDGVYFYPFDFIKGGIFANISQDEDRLERYNGQIKNRFETNFKKLEVALSFIMNCLGTIKICSDNLFSLYENQGGDASEKDERKKDRRTHKIKLTKKDTQQFEKVPLKGIWQIIKLIIDKSVSNRLLADSSIGNEHGSIINAIRKICQEPFVEFFGDTYGDQYYLTVRKPPFDLQGFASLLDGIVFTEDGQTMSEPLVIDVNDSDILEENLQYGAEAFSWYHINPVGNFSGSDDMAFAYLRAVYLKEYADIFGSRPLDLQTNYIPFQPILTGGKNNFISNAYMIKQGIYDLKYMIESNAYLPFVRRGNITIAGGNRKIKRGCLVRLVATGEVGIVESVSHTASFGINSVDRTTTISIDRVMVERFVKGVNIAGISEKVSYFNLIDTEIPEGIFNQNLSPDQFNSQVLGKWKTKVEVFNFFIKGQQFSNLGKTNIT